MPEEVLYPEYFVVLTPYCPYPVSAVMLEHVERQLNRWPRPRWVTFVDLAGARVPAARVGDLRVRAVVSRDPRVAAPGDRGAVE